MGVADTKDAELIGPDPLVDQVIRKASRQKKMRCRSRRRSTHIRICTQKIERPLQLQSEMLFDTRSRFLSQLLRDHIRVAKSCRT